MEKTPQFSSCPRPGAFAALEPATWESKTNPGERLVPFPMPCRRASAYLRRRGRQWARCRSRPRSAFPPQKSCACTFAPTAHSRTPLNNQESFMETTTEREQHAAWNKGVIVGQKSPFKLKEIWAIRVRLQLQHRVRELAMFDLGLDSKLRACDLSAPRAAPSSNAPSQNSGKALSSNPNTPLA